MVKLPNPEQLRMALQNATPSEPKPNGKDVEVPLDPNIVNMVNFLDRAIRSQNVTVGVVMAAVGILLGRKAMNPENLERLIYDVSMAIRVGFYLHRKGK